MDLRRRNYGGIDADALKFIEAAGITDNTHVSAINTLVLDLKSDGLWSKMKAVYPFVGGTAFAHKFNLKDPRNLDEAFRLTMNGGITHSGNGIYYDGINGWSDTKLNVSTSLTNNNFHLSYYSRTAFSTPNYGNEVNPSVAYNPNGWVSLRCVNRLNNAAFASGSDTNEYISASITNASYVIGSETASNSRKMYKNGSQVAVGTTNSSAALGNYTLVFCINSPNYIKSECAFASIGNGLSDSEANDLYLTVQKFQTTLNRQI